MPVARNLVSFRLVGKETWRLVRLRNLLICLKRLRRGGGTRETTEDGET